MHAQEIRRRAEESPRAALPAVAAAMWKAYSEGAISEAEAEALSAVIDSRRSAPEDRREAPRDGDAAPLAVAGIVKRYGSRPRTDASMARRRRWAASGRLPPNLAHHFTLAETAVLAVIAVEVGKTGSCGLHLDHIAALAGVSRTTVKNALREARALGLVTVEVRKRTAWRNDANLVRVISGEWLSWLRLARRETRIPVEGGGVKSATGTSTDSSESGRSRSAEPSKMGLARGVRRHRQGQDGPPMRQEGPWRPSAGRGRQP